MVAASHLLVTTCEDRVLAEQYEAMANLTAVDTVMVLQFSESLLAANFLVLP